MKGWLVMKRKTRFPLCGRELFRGGIDRKWVSSVGLPQIQPPVPIGASAGLSIVDFTSALAGRMRAADWSELRLSLTFIMNHPANGHDDTLLMEDR